MVLEEKLLQRLRANDSTLVTLELYENSIGAEDAKGLSEALKVNSTLVTLHLGDNSIGDEGAKDLSEALKVTKVNSTLVTLNLYKNSIGDEGAKDLSAALKVNSTLVTLNLFKNSIGAEGTKDLSEALKVNSTLVTLSLNSNSIGDEGAKDLSEALKVNSTLVTLHLAHNSIGDEGIKHLAWALQTNSTLTNLELESHPGWRNFNHSTASWKVPENPPSFAWFLHDLTSCSAAGRLRGLLLLLCLAFFLLPALVEFADSPKPFANATATPDNGSQPPTIIVRTLNKLCYHVPKQTMEEYVDPVSGFGIVVLVALLLAIWNNLPALAKHTLTGYCGLNAENAGAETAANVLANKEERALYLLVQLLVVMFSLGYHIVWGEVRPTGGFLCTVAARGTLAIFYKPILPAMWYGFMHLLDYEGWMLHHNILTDTLIAIIIMVFALWAVVAFIFSFPVIVCYFYFELLLCIPVSIFARANYDVLSADEEDLKEMMVEMNAEQRAEVAATKQLFKRLLGYTFFVSLVFATQLWPLYLGASYTSLAKEAVGGMGFSLSFWRPHWAWSFAWPKDLAMPEQIVLFASLSTLGIEQVVVGWRWVYWHVLFGPAGGSGWGWGVGRERIRRVPAEDALPLLEVKTEGGGKETPENTALSHNRATARTVV
jgi:hypothetical protein